MGLIAVTGAVLNCTMAMGVGSLNVTSQMTVLAEGRPVATIRDCAAGANITPMGMCTSMSNPSVSSATAAAMGVLTPMPCTPVPVGTWQALNPELRAASTPCLMQGATIQCAYAGTISVANSGQVKVKK